MKYPAHQPQRTLGLARSPCSSPSGPQLPYGTGMDHPHPPPSSPPRDSGLSRDSHSGALFTSPTQVSELLFQPGQLGEGKRKREREGTAALALSSNSPSFLASAATCPTHKVFRVSHPPPLMPDLKVPPEAQVFKSLGFFFNTNFQHQLEAAVKNPRPGGPAAEHFHLDLSKQP